LRAWVINLYISSSEMKKYLLKIIVFLIPIVLLANLADYTLSGILKKSFSFADGEYPVWNDLYNGKINSDIVIYGTSRALKHISPAIITDSLNVNAYNLGINGHSFKSEYFRHQLLLKYDKKPKLIIQTLDATSFERNSDLYNPDQFLPYMYKNMEMKERVYNGFKEIDYRLPMIRYYGKKEALLEALRIAFAPGTNKPVKYRGYQPWDKSWTNDLLKAQEKFGSFQVVSDSGIVSLFERYLQECSQLNIPVIFVYTPEYIEGQKFISNRSEILNLYTKLSLKYNIPFFNYANDSISYKKEYFYNSGHLNKAGAELFTAKLVGDLRKNRITTFLTSR
jgi:hypothetical protein